jgi:lysophospholipase L1-like esterase
MSMFRTMLSRRTVTVVLGVAATLSVVTTSGALASPGPGHQPGAGGPWVTSYTGSPVAGGTVSGFTPSCPAGTGLTDQTVRDIVYSTVGGNEVRVRLTNTFGDTPLEVGHAAVAVSNSTGGEVPGTIRQLSFGGSAQVTILPGAEALSDPVRLAVPAFRDLAVSVYLPDATGPATQHFFAQQTNYVAAGDAVLSRSAAPYTTPIYCSLFLDGVDVRSSGPVSGAVVALGDSITDGFGSTIGGNDRWPNYLARDLAVRPGNTLTAVDAGIGGNEVVTNRIPALYGVNALSRLGRDVLLQAGARYVILMEGVNDIGAQNTTAEQLIAADKQIIAQAHAAGVKIYGATLTPFLGSNPDYGGNYGTAWGLAQWNALNRWIRTSGAFDGVIDFAKVAADPANPLELNPAYNSGDYLHLNDAGYAALAAAAAKVLPLR